MKAIGYFGAGATEVLSEIELPVPVCGPHDLLVEIHAVSVNSINVKLRTTSSPKGGARVLGYDGAGVVKAVADAVTLFSPGDRVFHAGTIGRPGTNAQFHLVDERIVGRMPRSLSFPEAAALPLTAITAWELLFDQLGVPRGEGCSDGTILIINGAGGVGSILVQLASRLTGLKVVATASRPESCAWVSEMGADHVIDHHGDILGQLADSGIREVTHVAGLTQTDRHLPVIAKVIAPRGKLGLIDDPKVFDITPLRAKAVTVSWEGMFVRSLFQTPDMIEQHRLLCSLAELIDAGILRTTLNDHFGELTVANLARAHDHVASGRAVGKAVLGPLPD